MSAMRPARRYPAPKITALLVGQHLTRTTVADGTGFYNLLAMPPGVYDISAESPDLRA